MGGDSASCWSWCIGAELAEVTCSALMTAVKRGRAGCCNVEARWRWHALFTLLGTLVGIVGARRAWVLSRRSGFGFAPVTCRALVVSHEVYVGDLRRVVTEISWWAVDALSLHFVELESSWRTG